MSACMNGLQKSESDLWQCYDELAKTRGYFKFDFHWLDL